MDTPTREQVEAAVKERRARPTGKLTPEHFKHVPPKPGECMWWDWCAEQRAKGGKA